MSFTNFLQSLTGSAPAAAPAPQAPTALPSPGAAEPSAGAAPNQAQVPANPLEAWGKMFESAAPTPVVDPAAAKQVDHFNINPEQLAKAAGGINLSQVMSPELMAKALGGDQAAFMEVLNKTSQMTFMMAHQAALQAVKPAMDNRFDSFSKEMPATFKKLTVDATMQSDPLLSNPALKPVVEGLRSQILSKHPDATPQQLQQAIAEYFKATGISIAPAKAGASAAKKPAAGIDWDTFLHT